MELNELGKAVAQEWLRTGNIRSNVAIDAYMVMPNHFHGIISSYIENNPAGWERDEEYPDTAAITVRS
jgi:REP element-mobilizing transposase RayT